MRAIKFRAYDEAMQCMEMDVQKWTMFPQVVELPDRFRLMQFTGQTDCNKKDIYEGDILRDTLEGEFGDINHYFIVTWINEWGIFAALHHSEHSTYLQKGAEALDEAMFWTFNIEQGNTYTVCANIYEHPDYIRNCMIEEGQSMDDEFKEL